MRGSTLLVAVMLVGCGFGSNKQSADAGGDPPIDADDPSGGGSGSGSGSGSPDASIDGAGSGCQPTKLLTGGMDVAAQGWTVMKEGPATLSNGTDYAKLETSTTNGAGSGGQLLLTHSVTVEPDKPFKLQIEMMVERTDAHDPLDAPTAILGSFTAPVGSLEEHSQLIYIELDGIGWADTDDGAKVAIGNSAYHTYEIAVDADRKAEVRVDGTLRLTRINYLLGTIAIGDETVLAGRDSALHIRSVTIPCP